MRKKTNLNQSNMKLELKHLAPYLPYDCKVITNTKHIGFLSFTGNKSRQYHHLTIDYVLDNQLKPILRPLSDLTKEMDFAGYKSYPMQEFYIMYGGGTGSKSQFEKDYYDNIIYTPYKSLSYETVEKLFEWHFDVFGLIEKGLAIDVNTVKK